jgi:hypothetical protein
MMTTVYKPVFVLLMAWICVTSTSGDALPSNRSTASREHCIAACRKAYGDCIIKMRNLGWSAANGTAFCVRYHPACRVSCRFEFPLN